MVADIEESEEMDASELHARRLNAKEVLTPMTGDNLIFPVADGAVQTPGGDRRLNPSTLIRIVLNEERNKKFFEDSDELSSPTPLQDDSTRDDAVTGDFIYRHHVEPSVKLYMPREESKPIPLKYIDVARTTQTSQDVLLEKNIDDDWDVDGERELSDAWTGFTRFIC